MKMSKLLLACAVCLLFSASPAAAQSVTRLTTSLNPKSAYTISGNGNIAVWMEKIGTTSPVYSMKAVSTEGAVVERTLFTTDTSYNIIGVTGPYGGAVQVFHLSLRVSFDGSRAALHVFDRNGSRECFAIVNTSTGEIQVVPAGIPAGMGDQDVAMLNPASFDISDDGSVVVYTLTANFISGTEDASALAVVSPGSLPSRLAGYVSKANGASGVVYSAGPNHIGKPSIAGNAVVFAGNPNALRELPSLSNLYLMPLSGGEASVRASGITDPDPVNIGSHIFNISGEAPQRYMDFYPIGGGAAVRFLDNESTRDSFPFFDTEPGSVKVLVGGQNWAFWDKISVIRSSGEVEQLKNNDAQLPPAMHFGARDCSGGASYETWNAVPRNGGKILFTMCGEVGQDLFIQNGIKAVSPTPTAVPVSTPAVTPTPVSVRSCSLNVAESCRRRVRSGSVCGFTIRLYRTSTGAGIKNARFSLQRKSGRKRYQTFQTGNLGSKGTAIRRIAVRRTYTYRVVFPGHRCTTRDISVYVR